MAHQRTTIQKLALLNGWGKHSAFAKVMMIRGIGYRFFYVQNDFIWLKSEQQNCAKNPLLASFSDSQDTISASSEDCSISYWDYTIIEFVYARYLIVRAGHTSDLHLPLPSGIFIKTSKKDRKLVIYGAAKQEVFDLAHKIFEYRKPSPYTGRGVRRKQIKVVRKAGKRDKQ